MKLNELPRVRFACLPTPLQKLPHLAKVLDGPRVWVKRDDMTGLAFGGNKTRKLEYLIADALSHGADYIVTGAGFHSNWCTQTAAAARKYGLSVVLVKSGPEEGYGGEGWDGNHLLHHLMGAEVKVVRPDEFNGTIEETLEELEEEGHNPYFIPVGGSIPLGAAGYINAVLELYKQSVDYGFKIDHLVHGTGSGGTQAGLVMGSRAFSTGINVIGASVGYSSKEEQSQKVMKIIEEAREELDFRTPVNEQDINIFTDYVGGGYGHVTEGKMEAVRLLADKEGLMLDPVYTATAMACLIDLANEGYFKSDENVVFLHTGGSVALFPYKEPIRKYIQEEEIPWSIPDWSPDRE